MKQKRLIILLLFACCTLGVQTIDVWDIRNFANFLLVSDPSGVMESASFTAYGEERRLLNGNSPYLFQAQEQENDLGLYLFPGRIYSAVEKRFFQPDPQSQFHSPDLFVSSVNSRGEERLTGFKVVKYGEADVEMSFISGQKINELGQVRVSDVLMKVMQSVHFKYHRKEMLR